MKTFYEKPEAELIVFEIEDRMMLDLNNPSQGVGDSDEEEL